MGGRVITEEYLSITGQGDIQIIPIATGSGPAAAVAGAIFGGAAAAATAVVSVAGAVLTSSIVGTALTTIGTSLLIGGITDLLSPQNPVPDVSSVSDIDPAIRGSYSFSGIQNVSNSGVPIPIIYGLVFSGSIIISSGTDSTQVVKSIT
jgi:predicted phage tail protein